MTTRPPFQHLIDDHADAVWRVCLAAAGADAEDCFQETFLSALRAYPGLHDIRNLRGWLLTIAQRKVIDLRRAQRRGPDVVDELTLQAIAAAPEPAADEQLWEQVRALPRKQSMAVTQRFANDLAYREIAAVMGCSEEAARRSVFEGLRRLRQEVRP